MPARTWCASRSGNPKQERWIDRYGAAVGAPVLIGIGGSLDFITGSTRRAPTWMQRLGLEWLHRAISEPRRLIGRYARDIRVFLPGVAAQAWRGRRHHAAVVPDVQVAVDAPTVMKVLGPVPGSRHERRLAALVLAGEDLTIDLTKLDDFDNRSVSALVGIIRALRRAGARVHVVERRPGAGHPGAQPTPSVLLALSTPMRG